MVKIKSLRHLSLRILIGGARIAAPVVLESRLGRAACLGMSLCTTQPLTVNGVTKNILSPTHNVVEDFARIRSIGEKIDIENSIRKIELIK